MSFDAITTALQTILRYDTTTFPAVGDLAAGSQVTLGDWRGMDKGYPLMAILYSGGYTENDPNDPDSMAALSEFPVTRTIKLDVIRKYTDDGMTRATFAQNVDAILQQIMQYPMLHQLAGGTAKLGRITSDGEPLPVFDKAGNGPFFLAQTFSIPVSEVLTITPLG